jgi:uncharacterized protein YbbC (DUF1343 family)
MSFKLGLEGLLENLQKGSFAIVTNASGVSQNLEQNIDLLLKKEVRLKRIFAPEHGFYGSLNDGEDVKDETYLGIKVSSMYSKDKKSIDAKDLEGIDTVIFDVQDVGSRPYTFLASLKNLLTTASKCGVSVVVCDRPNPLSNIVEGPMMKKENISFVGADEMPLRHGMTIGEVSNYLNRNINADLTVSKMNDYDPTKYYGDYLKYYVPPSLNLNCLDSVMNYSGLVLLEAVNVSLGRGTPYPFLQVGFNNNLEISAKDINGAILRKTSFVPLLDPFGGSTLYGYFIHITNRNLYSSIKLTIKIIESVYEKNEELINFKKLCMLSGSTQLEEALRKKLPISEIYENMQVENEIFKDIKRDYTIY